ncbi:MAG: InlB B-repeat-containing protein [Coriobacteriales bacterium]|jgi:uncharacterized repeat protein (TIGR02543 family)|nr:InlB B-repeat-containing protein [Coriobacteriales bacterium]
MKQAKRIAVSVLIIALVFGLCTGCAPQTRTAPDEKTAADTASNESTRQQEAESPQAEDGPVTVTFDATGGDCDTSQKEVKYQQSYGDLPVPRLANNDFEGWYTAQTEGEKVGNSTTVTTAKDHTLYAHWTLKDVAYLAAMSLYEWAGDGDEAFHVLSEPGDEIKDTHGASFWQGAIGLRGKVNLSVDPATVTYDINKEYGTFSGYWGPLVGKGNRSFWIEIYGDGKLLYTTPEQKEGSATVPFSVDVSGVRHLTLSIKSSTMEFSHDWSEYTYAIFDPILTR